MRTRDLKPGFFRNPELAALPAVVRLLYQGLWCIADKKGRLADSPALIKADIFPFENIPVEKHLKLLEEQGFISRYQAEGKRCIWLPTFRNHQHPHPKEPESVLPSHPEDPLPGNVQATEITRTDSGESGASNVASASHSNLSPLTSNALTPIPSVPSGSSVPSGRKVPLRTLLDLTSADIAQLKKSCPSADINARWGEWILWIEEKEEERMPDNKLRAFEGWLKKPAPVGARR